MRAERLQHVGKRKERARRLLPLGTVLVNAAILMGIENNCGNTSLQVNMDPGVSYSLQIELPKATPPKERARFVFVGPMDPTFKSQERKTEEINLHIQGHTVAAEERKKQEDEQRISIYSPTPSSGEAVTAAGFGKVQVLGGVDVWDILADCESGDGTVGAPYFAEWDYIGENHGRPFDGGLQFTSPTWTSLNTGYESAWQAPAHIQKQAAANLLSTSTWHDQWPDCSIQMQAAGVIPDAYSNNY